MAPLPQPHYTNPQTNHPGSSAAEIENEPEWHKTRSHRVGVRDSNDRYPGLTHDGDDAEFLEQARQEADELRKAIKDKDLLSVRDFMEKQEDYHLRFPENHPKCWRYMLHTTENFIKYTQDWPVNVKKRQQQEQNQKEAKEPKTEHEWRRGRGENETHNEAHATGDAKDGDEELLKKYSPHEVALLRLLEHERDYIQMLQENDGSISSPMAVDFPVDLISEADQFTPDNWIPRSDHLIRLTGKHPLNAEPELSALHSAGLITPNHLHYVRNHGPVPHLLWKTHTIDVENGKLTLKMDDLQSRFQSINIAVALACDGNRRKELNMIRRSKGFNWGPGAISCAYWKGPLLRDVLLAAGVRQGRTRRWVNFEGCDQLSEGKYATCIPLSYAMDSENDVILAYEMNNRPIPADHGYPVRVIIPGYVGGRCVKWLKRVWISDKENDSHYHIWDNRVLPAFILDMDSEFSHTMFHHPSTACNEQNLNSVIVKPAHGEKINLSDVKAGHTYRIEGLAYDGGGHEVQRVEVSLDGGTSWLYCIRSVSFYLTSAAYAC